MDTVPVASPSPRPRFRLPRRGIALALVAAAATAALVVFAVFAWPVGSHVEPVRWVDAGALGEIPVNEPVRFPEQRFWLVKLESDEVLALYQRDPHRGCTVPWRPDFRFMGRTGWFRNPCYGETYDIQGRCVSGPCIRGLDRFEVRIEGGRVRVNVQRLIQGPSVSEAQ